MALKGVMKLYTDSHAPGLLHLCFIASFMRFKNSYHIIILIFCALLLSFGSGDGVVGTGTRLRTGRSGARIPAGARYFFSLICLQWFSGPPNILLIGYRGYSPVVNLVERPRLEVVHPHLVLLLIISWARHLLSLCAFTARTGIIFFLLSLLCIHTVVLWLY
jgi:hypothetical protein